MPNEFVARNGIFALNNSQITGSLNVSNGITGSLFGTASVAQIANTVDFRETDTSTDRQAYVPLFGQGIAFSGTVLTTVTQTDGKILAGGGFTRLNGTVRNFLVRLNSNGTEDTSFYTNLGTGFNNQVEGVAVQSDGKILVVGYFTALNGTTRNRLVRLNSDGTVDTSFYTNLGSGFGNVTFAVAVQSDGKILIGGAFISLNGTTRNYLVRLNSDGTVDTSFYTNLGTGFNNTVEDITIQSDGKIIIGGQFTTLNGTTRNRLVRLNSDGTVDTSFSTNLGTGFSGRVESIAVQSDGKILIGGWFSTLNGTTRNRLVRLNSDGTVDTSFYSNLGTGFNGFVETTAIQTDGKIVVGGWFSTLNGTTRNYLVRLNSDGTVDTSFSTNLGNGPSSIVYHTAIQSDGRILVGGAFNSFNGSLTLGYFIRLTSEGLIDPADYITTATLTASSISQAQGGAVTISNTLNTGTINSGNIVTSELSNAGPHISTLNLGTISTNTTDQVMYSYDVGLFAAAMIEMYIRMIDGSFRLTQLNIANDGNGNYTYTEQSTSDVGNTTPITVDIAYNSGDGIIEVRATNTSSNYDATFRAYVRLINA